MLVSDILTSVRDVLADQSKKRWQDDVLIRLLNSGVRNFILTTGYAKAKIYVGLEQEVSTYDLSNYAISIDRVMYKDKVLEAKSDVEMDLINPTWEDEVGLEPRYVIFENLRQGVFRIYPKVSDEASEIISQNQVYGGLIDINVTEDFAIIPGMEDVAFSAIKHVVVYYIERHAELTSLDDTVKLPDLYKEAVVAFVTGQALRLDQDTLNRQFGAEQLSIYDNYVTKALGKEAKANNTFHNRQVAYRGFQ